MKLIEKLNNYTFIKGTIVLFLFLHFTFSTYSQNYSLNLLYKKSELPKFIKRTNFNKTFADSALIYLQLQKIRNRLFLEGYIAASFDSIKFDSLKVNAYLFFGKKYQINSLHIKGIYSSLKRKYHLSDSGIQFKEPFNPVDLPVMYENIINEYENSGYPFAELIPEKVDIKDSGIYLKLRLRKNDLYRFNKIIIKGKAKISPRYISRFLSLYEGDVYKEEVIKSINKKIETLPFLSEIRSPEVDFFNNKADVFLYFKSEKTNLFNGVIGFIPDKNNDNKLSFTGNLDFNLRNNLGKGETVFLKWTRTAKLSQKLNAGFTLPYVFKSPFSLQSQFYLDKRDTSFMKISAELGIDFNFKNRDKTTVFVRKKQSMLLTAQNTDTDIFKNSEILLFGLAYQSEKFDYRFNPSRGYFFNTEFAGGNRNTASEKRTYYEANIIAEYYIPMYKQFVLKFKSDTKYAFPNDLRFYKNEIFDLGGFNSLKGFDENRFQTSAYSVLIVEQRYLLEKNSNIFTFFNIAGFKENTEPKNINFPYGFGLGTNLNTKAGIFSISYALGTLTGNYLHLSDSKIHIGYVNRF